MNTARIVAFTALLICSGVALGGEISTISGTSTATLITDPGPHQGWYLYEIEIEWHLFGQGSGLSHPDLILKLECAGDDHLIEFDAPAALSSSEKFPEDPEALGWTGYFERNGDPSLDPPLNLPVVKYEDPFFPTDDEPASEGVGTFWFYTNAVPEYGTYENALVAKAGLIPDTYGYLTGAYPSCTLPEPGAFILLGIGGLAILRRVRRDGRVL